MRVMQANERYGSWGATCRPLTPALSELLKRTVKKSKEELSTFLCRASGLSDLVVKLPRARQSLTICANGRTTEFIAEESRETCR